MKWYYMDKRYCKLGWKLGMETFPFFWGMLPIIFCKIPGKLWNIHHCVISSDIWWNFKCDFCVCLQEGGEDLKKEDHRKAKSYKTKHISYKVGGGGRGDGGGNRGGGVKEVGDGYLDDYIGGWWGGWVRDLCRCRVNGSWLTWWLYWRGVLGLELEPGGG